MTILHIITRLIIGGAQQNTIATCAAQVAAGHRVVLAYGPIYGPEGSMLPQAQATGAELVEVSAMRRAVLPVHDLICHRELRHLIRTIKPDVVHTHSSKAGIVGRAAAWKEKVPVVLHTVHGLAFHDQQPRLVHALYVRLERWAARRCHHMLAVTDAMIDAMVDEGIAPREKFTMVPSGLDLAMYERTDAARSADRQRVRQMLGIAPAAPVVGLLGRLDPLKGQSDLIAITPRLLQVRKDLRILLVGDGWHRPALEKQIRELGLEDVVIMAGLVAPDQVAAYLCAMDVNTLPSYQEGQPRTLLQSLLAGTSIVAYDAGGIPEVCIPQKTGRLAPTGNHDALARAVVQALDEPADARATLIENGRVHVRERFDQRTMTAQIQAICERIASGH